MTCLTIALLILALLLPFRASAQVSSTFEPVTVLGRGALIDAQLSTDETLIAVASAYGVWLYDAADLTAEPRHFIDGDSAFATSSFVSAALTSDNRYLIGAAESQRSVIWDVESGARVAAVDFDSPPSTLAVHPTATEPYTFVIATTESVSRHDFDGVDVTSTGVFPEVDGAPLSAAFSSDGSRLAVGTDRGWIGLWDVTDERLITQVRQSGAVHGVSFSPDGQLLAATDAQSVVLYDSATGELISAVPLPEALDLYEVAFGANGQIVAAGAGGLPGLFYVIDDGQIRLNLPHPGVVVSARFSADGQRFLTAGGDDGSLRWWNAGDGSPIAVSGTAHVGYYTDADLANDGTLLALVTGTGVLELWDVASRERAFVLPLGGSLSAVAFDPLSDGARLAYGRYDGSLVFWDTRRGEPTDALLLDSAVTALTWSADGLVLAALTETGTVALIDMQTLSISTTYATGTAEAESAVQEYDLARDTGTEGSVIERLITPQGDAIDIAADGRITLLERES